MKTSVNGINLIKKFEGLHDGDLSKIGLQPKMCPAGIWTEGYGHAMRDKKGNFIKGESNRALALSLSTIHTEEEAINVLKQDLTTFELIVSRKVTQNLNQNQFDALVSHTYNTGGSDTLFKLCSKTLVHDTIYSWFTTRYIMGGGKILPGLVKRRKAEADLFFKNI